MAVLRQFFSQSEQLLNQMVKMIEKKMNEMCQFRTRVIVQQNKALIITAHTLAISKKPCTSSKPGSGLQGRKS